MASADSNRAHPMSLRDTAGDAGGLGPWASVRLAFDQVIHALRADDERGRAGRSALSAFSIRVAGAGLAYLSQVAMARWMGSFEYGIFVFVWVWVLILGGLSPLGLSIGTIRFVPEYRETGRVGLLRGLLLGSRLIGVGVGLCVMLAALAALYVLGDRIESYYLAPAILILLCLPVYSLVDVQDGIARGFSWITLALAPPYIIRPVLLLVAMAVAAAAGWSLTAVTAAGCAVFAYWATGLAQALVLQRRVSRKVPPSPRAYDVPLWLKTSTPLLLVLGFDMLLQNTDILVLSRYLAPNEIAIYFAALKTMGLMSFVHFAVGAAAANRFSAHRARGQQAELAGAVREAVRWTFWPSLAAALALLALGKPLLWLFGAEFTAGYPIMFILAAGFLVRAATGPADYVLNMLGEQNRCAGVLALAALANIALNFTLIPHYGLYGAATATALSLAGAALALHAVARRRLGLTLMVGSGGGG